MIKVQLPMKRRMTKPPNTVLISGMPLCLAYVAYVLTNTLAQAAKNTFWNVSNVSSSTATYQRISSTYRIQDEEKILNNKASPI